MPGRALSSRVADAALALVLAAAGVAEIWVPFNSRQGVASGWWSTAVVLVLCTALAFRRDHPGAVAVFVLLGMPVAYTISPIYILFQGMFVPLLLALFTAARHGRGRAAWYAAAAAAVTLLFMDLRIDELQTPSEIVFHWGVFSLVFLAGITMRRMDLRAKEAQQRAVAVEVAAAERILAAVADERTRVARELHDIVAHAVSVIVVQAGAAEQVALEDPAYAQRALATIRTSGSDALAEMRRLVAVLRDPSDVHPLQPQPGLSGIDALVREVRAAGIEVTVDAAGAPGSLPAGLDLAVYRVIQEALSNVRQHARATRAEVRVSSEPGTLVVEVRDNGRGAAGAEPGHGLIGMRERVSLYGGSLRTHTEPGGGFTLSAVLPLDSPADPR
nr:sensor histidine kinase [uncultured Friedmanniella sp.]